MKAIQDWYLPLLLAVLVAATVLLGGSVAWHIRNDRMHTSRSNPSQTNHASTVRPPVTLIAVEQTHSDAADVAEE